ncbi:MAG: hypothetical protein QW112_02655 [Candidatus Micrarchaeia archaeon]
MAKISDVLVWFGRIVISVLVGIFIFNGLKTNPKFAANPAMVYGSSIVATLLCIILLFTIFKKD